MDVLEQLRFGCRWITAEQDIDLASEATTATLGELLGDTTEELAQDSFLHIVALPDGGRKRVNQDVLDVRLLGKGLELGNLLGRELDRVIFEAHILHESTLRLVSVLINGGSINLTPC